MSLASALYDGRVQHRRFIPRRHNFSYPLFMVYLDLGELDRAFPEHGWHRWLGSANRPAVLRFRREDFLSGAATPLDDEARDLVEQELGERPEGPVRVLTHLRVFGFQFNPVRYYYCFEGNGETLHSVIAEIHNTPWNERHCYVMRYRDGEPAGDRARRTFDVEKTFHVSPFMPMEQRYAWSVGPPGEQLSVYMRNHEDTRTVFDATLDLQRLELTSTSLLRMLRRHTLMTFKVVTWIYLQALRLWWKGIPFHTHPRKRPPAEANPRDLPEPTHHG